MSTHTILYTGKTTTTGGREGRSRSDDGRLDIKLSAPGSRLEGTNPEQLLGAGWSACFTGALRLAAQARKIHFPDSASVAAEIDLGQGPEGFFLQARLTVRLPGLDHDVVQSLLEAAHQTCPYSKAMRGNIEVQTTIA